VDIWNKDISSKIIVDIVEVCVHVAELSHIHFTKDTEEKESLLAPFINSNFLSGPVINVCRRCWLTKLTLHPIPGHAYKV